MRICGVAGFVRICGIAGFVRVCGVAGFVRVRFECGVKAGATNAGESNRSNNVLYKMYVECSNKNVVCL